MKLWNDEDTVVVTEAGELLRKASEAISRVRELHKPFSGNIVGELEICDVCYDSNGNPVNYPCRTIQALDGEQE
jgi:hypothetical protein